MPFQISIHDVAVEELRQLRAFEQRRILDEIDEQLTHQPNLPTKRKKCLEALAPTFEYEPPIWQLRIGEFRVFYDVDESNAIVNVRAIRQKDGKTTEEIA